MKLTKLERLILSNQYRILEALYPKQGYDRSREIVENGYEQDYERLAEHIDDDVVTTEESKEVRDILHFHRILKQSYDKLDDKSGIEPESIEFAGFDGNDDQESKLLGYVRYYCAPGERKYTELNKGDDYNSHTPMLSTYRTMLKRWHEMGKPVPLTTEQIQKVIA
ncbi:MULTISPECIES: YfbU family protein [Sorangium]|uniref:YfbU family protein n=1 Tax=Sorangium cellulosum TaxID=56 RepID=A0A4P2QQ19_SORCE|nr:MULTISPECIES: YfbU family protein [Sorangium]AUX31951.1 uncharacterized protein SOCE836_040860 [Sorangium cellulosum]WCQ91325.1 hypothetical protein NQZ70_04041 [Sorangium sp. Soce836]